MKRFEEAVTTSGDFPEAHYFHTGEFEISHLWAFLFMTRVNFLLSLKLSKVIVYYPEMTVHLRRPKR